MVRLVLFDIDGTLIRTGGAGIRAFEKVFTSEFGIQGATARMNFAGRTDTSLVREFFTRNSMEMTPERANRFFDHYLHWLDHLLTTLEGEVCPGVNHFLMELQELPEKPLLGLLTGNVRLGAELKLRHFSLWDFFVTGAFGDDHEDRNELARIAHSRGMQLLNRPIGGHEVLVIGDTPRDVECARTIGARMLAVATGGSTWEELQDCKPTWLVRDLRESNAVQFCTD